METWRSGQSPGSSYNGTSNVYDVIGDRFATDKMTICCRLGPIVIQIYTNNQPGGWNITGKNFGVADIAVDTGQPNLISYDAYTQQHFPAPSSRFDYGINMQAYAASTPGQAGNGNAFLGPVTVWETSFANVNPTGGLVYGGAYKSRCWPWRALNRPRWKISDARLYHHCCWQHELGGQ